MILPYRRQNNEIKIECEVQQLKYEISWHKEKNESLKEENIELTNKVKKLEYIILKSKYSHVISHKKEGCYGYYYCTENTTENLYAHDGFITVYDKNDNVIILPTSQIINIKKL